jgi:FdhD protein
MFFLNNQIRAHPEEDEMVDPEIEIECERIMGDSRVTMRERIATEKHLELTIDDYPPVSFVFTSGLEEQLVLGNLFSSGIIKEMKDIEKLEMSSSTCRVKLSQASMSVSSSSKSTMPNIAYDQILETSEILRQNQKHHHATRSFHAAIIMDLSTKQWFTCEDVGRHNAVDKVIGFSLQEGYNLSSSLLILTGRLTYQIVQKCVTANIPVIASLTVATDQGIQTAKKAKATLLGALSNKGCWLYHEGTTQIQL